MREEFAAGKTTKEAVASGYDRAFLAIVDSNLTTLMTGVILFVFGSGPIRGFAVTLCGGIIISMFTALVVTRLIFNLFVTDMTMPFKMMKWISDKISINFIGKAKLATSISAVIIAITVGLFAWRAKSEPASVFAVDFVGGLSLTYKAVDKVDGKTNVELDVETVRKAVKDTGVSDQTVQRVVGENNEVFTLVKTSTTMLGDKSTKDVIEKAIDKAFPEATVTLHSADEVGSQIGEELKSDAFWSICIALIGIIIYVSFRFRFGFALGGVIALAHDALITLGIYTVMGYQVSLTTVAALLTIVGYSINDTIVIFDRIREELDRDETTPFPELVCRALNQTLSRTLLTTISTLLPVAALYFFGGAAIHDFALALFIGMIAGTYSTLFIAPGVMLLWYKGKRPPKPVVEADPSDIVSVDP
jgi:SecD/SecF fusion protein